MCGSVKEVCRLDLARARVKTTATPPRQHLPDIQLIFLLEQKAFTAADSELQRQSQEPSGLKQVVRSVPVNALFGGTMPGLE